MVWADFRKDLDMTDRMALDETLRAAHLELGQALVSAALGNNTPLPREIVAKRLERVQKSVAKAQKLLEAKEDIYAGFYGP
jgi:hypothetical protein